MIKPPKNKPLKVLYSKRLEGGRIKYTIKKLGWFKKQGYQINLPKRVWSNIKCGKRLSDKTLAEIVNKEYDANQYSRKAQRLILDWNKIQNKFFTDLSKLKLPLQKEYKVYLSKYGVGGSYELPNKIIINFDYAYGGNILATTIHEIIHLTIEKLIGKYKIEHWTKERIVDLFYGKFFPKKRSLQKNPANAQTINRLFKQYYPDVKNLIKQIHKIYDIK